MSDFEATVKRIMERTAYSREAVLKRIRDKHRELGIVTLEGAAKLVAGELGVRGEDYE